MNYLNKINYILSDAYNKKYEIKDIADENIIKQLLQTDYSEAYNNLYTDGITIYRGMRTSRSDVFITEPKLRISTNTSNIYTTLLSEILPSWKDYPKRNKSFICTFDYYKSAEYGYSYIVLPKNGSKIAICPKEDIWFSFNKINTLARFNYDFINLLALTNTLGFSCHGIEEAFSNYNNKDIYTLLQDLENYTNEHLNDIKHISEYYDTEIGNLIYNFIDENNRFNTLEFLDDLFNPAFNGFDIQDTKNLEYHRNPECWFSAPALFINIKTIKYYLYDLMKDE